MSVFLYSPSGSLRLISSSEGWRKDEVLQLLSLDTEPLCPSSVYLSLNGRLVHPNQQESMPISENDVLRVHYRLPGGKGGFGSMLRAIGAQIEKTTSREACRDLSGRRMRDVNNEKKITEWVAKQAEKERELAKQKQERLERRRAAPKHNFDDQTYTKEIQNNLERIDDALKQGLQTSSSTSTAASSSKRKAGRNGDDAPKKRKMWLDLSSEEFDDSDDELHTSPTEGPSTSTSTSTSTKIESIDAEPTTSSYTEYTNQDAGPSTSTQAETITSSCIDSRASEDSSENQVYGLPMATVKEDSLNDSEDTNRISSNVVEESANGTKSKNDGVQTEEKKPFSIDVYSTAEELEAIGLDALKQQLISLGLKCGGTLQERAARLFTTKGKSLDELDPSLFAKPSKGKKKPKKK